MLTQSSQSKKLTTPSLSVTHWVYFFIACHVILWTIIPSLVRYNLPLDAIEGSLWGHQLEWGYDKNPFLNGWLSALAVYLTPSSGWMMYAFSQLSVATCFWVVWQLCSVMLTRTYALVAVLLLEGVQYFNFHAIDFNDNTLELGLWALSIYFFYQALQHTRCLSWLATGFFAALALMAKYYTAVLLMAMLLFLIIPKENRNHLRTLPPYLGLLTFYCLILPHIIWLFFHDFITITYVFERASSPPSWWNHLFYPAQFTLQQCQVFLPAIILLAVLFLGKRPVLAPQRIQLSSFHRSFLIYLGLLPLILTVLLSFLFGIKLRAGWGMPLLSLWTIILLAIIQPEITKAKLKIFIGFIFIFLIVLLSGYTISLINSNDFSSANFPGREIATTITRKWQEKYHRKLNYVAGSRWLGGNLSFYSADHPAVFIEWDKKRAPWISLADLQQKGGVFIWDISDGETLPKAIQERYPQLEQVMTLKFALHRNQHHLASAQVGIAFLPPK